jgi:hypothetical protein
MLEMLMRHGADVHAVSDGSQRSILTEAFFGFIHYVCNLKHPILASERYPAYLHTFEMLLKLGARDNAIETLMSSLEHRNRTYIDKIAVMATGYHEAAAPFPGYAGIVKLLKPLVL